MNTILCYGDSNTWGHEPISGVRFPLDVRWPGVLRKQLGDGYWVIEEGLNGRTTVMDDPVVDGRNGKKYLIPCLNSHKPIDLVALMLGSNDLKPKFSLTAYDIARGIFTLVEMIQKSGTGNNGAAPQILIISPPHVLPVEGDSDLKEEFEGAARKSHMLAKYYSEVAHSTGCRLLDAAEVVSASQRDGIHLEAAEHEKLGKAVAAQVKESFS